MPGTYHIIHANADYSSRRVRCYESGRYHRHKTHVEEYVRAVCGTELIRNRDKFCNIGIATPSWDYDWCHKCVRAFPWKDGARKQWQAKGIETIPAESWADWLETPEGEYAKPR